MKNITPFLSQLCYQLSHLCTNTGQEDGNGVGNKARVINGGKDRLPAEIFSEASCPVSSPFHSLPAGGTPTVTVR